MKFKKPNRKVTRVFLHCSASDNPDHDDITIIERWHRENGWSTVGYHFFIQSDGEIQEGRSLERDPAAQLGHNQGTIAICMHGLKSFSFEQKRALKTLCKKINKKYFGQITFHGHNEVDPERTCPVYNYKKILKLQDSKMPFVGFHGNPATEWLKNDREMKLLKDFSYTAKNRKTYTAPLNTIVDGASIPKFVWTIIGSPFVGAYRNSSIIHDWMCQEKITKTSKQTHKLFNEMMEVDGVPKMKRSVMYWAVKSFGPKWG